MCRRLSSWVGRQAGVSGPKGWYGGALTLGHLGIQHQPLPWAAEGPAHLLKGVGPCIPRSGARAASSTPPSAPQPWSHPAPEAPGPCLIVG